MTIDGAFTSEAAQLCNDRMPLRCIVAIIGSFLVRLLNSTNMPRPRLPLGTPSNSNLASYTGLMMILKILSG